MPVIRPAQIEDARAMARVHVDTWRSAYAGIVPDEHLANLSDEHSEARWNEYLTNHPDVSAFVAEDPSGQIVAITSCGPVQEALHDFDGEIYVLYVLQPFQGRGYGKLLVTQAARDLARRGFHSMVIWVLKENPARQFYERLGGQLSAEKVVEIGGKQLVDVAYTWPDLAGFDG